MPIGNNIRGEDIKDIAALVKEELAKTGTVTPPPVPENMPLNDSDPSVRPTGIPDLDAILHGGFPNNSTILFSGGPGLGKTILSLQWLMAGYEKYGEPGIYLSLTEPVNKMIKTNSELSFFKREYSTVGKVFFEDMRTMMHSLGLEDKELTTKDIGEIVDALSDLMYKCGAKRIVIDSITAIAYRLQDKHLIRTFIHELDALLTQTNINVVMTSEVIGDNFSVFGVEEFISDGIIQFYREDHEAGQINKLRVIKMRGTSFDNHPTSYRITGDGFVLFPRLSRSLSYQVSDDRTPTGVPGLDTMIYGGYFKGSSILVTGSSGAGKSILSLQFILEGLKNGGKGIFVSFEESRDQIIRNAKGFTWDLESYEKSDNLKIITAYPEQKYLEEHINTIRDEVETFKPNILVIDSLSSLGNVFQESTIRDFVSRLNGFLKENLVTTIYTHATATLLGANQITDAHLSTITDQIIMLRYVEIESELRHAVLILKMRGSKHDKSLREMVFSDTGLEVTTGFSGLEGVLSGSTHKVSDTIEEQLHTMFLEVLGPMGESMFKEEKAKGLNYEGVQKLLSELSDQGILSVRRKEETVDKLNLVFGKERKLREGSTDSLKPKSNLLTMLRGGSNAN